MNTILDQIKVFNNVLTKEQFEITNRYIKTPTWGKNTSRKDADNVFWGIGDLENEEFFSVNLLNQINEKTQMNFKLDHILVNGQSTLQDGEPHFDNVQPNGYTFMIYMNHVWDMQWGGMTVFLDRYVDEQGKAVILSKENKCFFPTPNMGVLFPSNVFHFAFGPTKKYAGLRVTIAFKLYTGDTFITKRDKNAQQKIV